MRKNLICNNMTNELRTREFHEARNPLATLLGGAGLAVG